MQARSQDFQKGGGGGLRGVMGPESPSEQGGGREAKASIGNLCGFGQSD